MARRRNVREALDDGVFLSDLAALVFDLLLGAVSCQHCASLQLEGVRVEERRRGSSSGGLRMKR